jgi:hypothetical protein
MKLLILLLFCTSSLVAFSQNDLLVLKQRNHVVQTWVTGSYIDFQFSSKQWIQGRIKKILHDSLVIDQMILKFSFSGIDSTHFGLFKLHVKEICGLPKKTYGGGFISNGRLFQLGGAAYILVNIFNSINHQGQVFSQKNLTGIGIAAGVFIIGKLLASTYKSFIVIGKKYTLETITSSVTK